MPYVRVKDARASLDYYHRCLGFHKEFEQQFEPASPRCVSIARGSLRILLSEHAGDGNFGICLYCPVNDADRLHAEFARAGALHITGVEEMPWGRDFSVRDLDGNELRFGSPRPDASIAA